MGVDTTINGTLKIGSGGTSTSGLLAIDNSISITESSILAPTTVQFDTYVFNVGASTIDVVFELPAAIKGQIITLVVAQNSSANNIIVKAAAGILYNFGTNTAGALTEIILNNVGSTLQLKYIENPIDGNSYYYIIGQNDITVQ